jgi:hypothetical protein
VTDLPDWLENWLEGVLGVELDDWQRALLDAGVDEQRALLDAGDEREQTLADVAEDCRERWRP